MIECIREEGGRRARLSYDGGSLFNNTRNTSINRESVNECNSEGSFALIVGTRNIVVSHTLPY
jgi:hypothetical protein